MTVPTTTGTYNFQWRMVQDAAAGFFGDYAQNLAVSVVVPPSAPAYLTATPGDGQVSLSWPVGAWANIYNIKRATTSGGPYTTVGANVSGTTYTDTGRPDGTAHYYVVTSVNLAGESVASDEALACPLTPASADAASPSYGYTGDGLRAWKGATAAARTYFFYDGTSSVCEMDSTGAVTAVNTFGATGLISRHTPTGGSAFYAFDPQGSVCERLSGASLDAETGLELLTHRYYDSAAGRFVTRDPIGYEGSLNLYAYTADNPVNGIDPTGFSQDVSGNDGTVWLSLAAFIPMEHALGFNGDHRGFNPDISDFRIV